MNDAEACRWDPDRPGLLRGAVVEMGDDVNTDVLHPSRFYSLDRLRVKSGLQVAADGEPAGEGVTARIIVGGRNFGYGSSRETTIQALVDNGVALVVAHSISRIFWRNAINAGLWVLELADARTRLAGAEELAVDPAVGCIHDATSGVHLARAAPLDPYEREVLEAGGILAWLESGASPV